MDGIWETIKESLTSKKLIASLAAAITAAALKIGLELPTETVGLIIGPIIAYVIGQGWADRGKEAAKVEAIAQQVEKDGIAPKRAIEMIKNT